MRMYCSRGRQPRGVHNTADGTRPDAHAFCKIVPDEIDAREEIEQFTEQNECEQNAKHGEKVHEKPLLLTTNDSMKQGRR